LNKAKLACLSAALAVSTLSMSKTTLDEVSWSEARAWQCAKSISIPTFKVTGEFKAKRPQAEYTRSFAAALAESLKGSGRFESVVLLEEGQPPTTELVLEGDFMKLTTGSRAGRFWIGCGVGRSKCQVRIICYRVSDHAKVFELEHARLSAEGLKSDELQENVEEVEADVSEVLIGAKQGCPDGQPPSPAAASGALDPQHR